MEKKTKLTISGGIAKKSIKNIDRAKNLGKHSVIIEKQSGKFSNKGGSFRSNHLKQKIIFQVIKELLLNRIMYLNHHL